MRIGIGTSIVGQGVAGEAKQYLDDIAGTPTAAYSVRKVISTYTDPVVEVRRTVSAVTVEADVSFDGETITLDSPVTITSGSSSATTLGEFVGDAGYTDVDSLGSPQDAFVATWYDQAGSNDATQATASDQPKIYDASTGLVTENGQVALNFDGSDDFLQLDFGERVAQPLTMCFVLRSDSPSATQNWNDSSGNALQHYMQSGQFRVYGGSTAIIASYTSGAQYSVFSAVDGSNSVYSYNGTFSTFNPGTFDLSTGGILRIGKKVNGVSPFDGIFQEIIIYNSDKSADRTDIEGNINDFFSIYA